MSAQVAVDLPTFRLVMDWLKGQERIGSQQWSRLWGGAGYDAFWQHQALDLLARLTARPVAELTTALRTAAEAEQ